MTQVHHPTNGGSPPLLESLSSTLLPELRRYLSHHRGAVDAAIAPGGPESGEAASRRYAKIVDGLLSALFHATRGLMLKQGKWSEIALAAVGSYGRTTLSPFSDLDVRLLCDGDADGVQGVAEALLYPLWDAGLMVGHQVVTFDEGLELAKTDLPTATSLLDWRHLEGEAPHSERFLQRAFDEVFGLDRVGDFLARLSQIAGERKERFGGSVFLLEPEIKSGAGGLRDVDLMHWAARARWRVKGLGELVRLGVLLPAEWEELQQAIQFLMRLRNNLHFRTRKRIDRLGFLDQELLAGLFGYGKGGAAVEAFMSDYYRHARQIERTSEMVLRRAAPPPKHKPSEVSLGSGLKLVGHNVGLEDDDAIYSEPSLVFRLYEEAVERGLGVTDGSRRAVTRAVSSESFCEQLRSDADSAAVFRRLVCSFTETKFKYGSVLTELHDVGLLLAMIPEFRPVVGRVHHDVYHVYTVDVHSIAAVDKLRAICRGDLKDSLPLATRLATEQARPEVLFFATLLHDIGKDTGGRKHAERGADLADGILKRLRFAQENIHGVQHLVTKHLNMYLVATRRDVDDPRTLEAFAGEVEGTLGLRELYLLTIADVSTTSPAALTTWKQRMLDELFEATDRWLTTGETRRGASAQEGIFSEVQALLPEGVDTAFALGFLRSVSPRYLATNTPEWIAKHIEQAQLADSLAASVTMMQSGDPHVEIAVVADDEPGVLAKICATLSARKIKVVSAQIHSWLDPNGRRRVLDLFWVRAGQDPSLVLQGLAKINQQLTDLVKGKLQVADLVSGKPHEAQWSLRPSPPVPIQVRIDNHGASRHTILEVITKDRADLLFWISNMIFENGLSIDLAKIHTEGVRVTDVFYVCTKDGNKLQDEARLDALKHSITRTLQNLEVGNEA